MTPVAGAKEEVVHKSWKKINEERKALKKQRKQEKLLKQLAKTQKSEETSKNIDSAQKSEQKEHKENPSTVSIAVPGSILENAQSAELRSYVAGQIARAACIFRVSEVIVFDDIGLATARETKRNFEADDSDDAEGTSRTVRSSVLQLARILQYLECPQYLRKFFFPLHKDLKYSGLLNPLDAPHHLRQQNIFRYREGIVTEKLAKEGHCYVNVGLLNDVLVNKALTAGLRVTVKLEKPQENVRKQRGTIVSPDEPRRETGVYWGYTVRIAHSISEIFTKSPYPGGYDLTVGTSDRGTSVHEVPSKSFNYNHLLLVFGGLQGLEAAVANEDKLQIDDPKLLFDHYINVLPKQGSRTIRTEEAILIAMASLQEKFNPKVEDIEEELIKEALPRSEDTGGIIPKPSQTKMERKRKRLEENEQQILANNEADVQEETVNVEVKKPKEKKVKNNPFSNKKESAVVDFVDNGVAAGAGDDDFEIVPSGKVDKTTSNAANNVDDLSRFD
ncbi:putative methyltransferase C9orf114 [Musca vetustissima]|uniref:putative methyltransferase C9orf114 n=1 Tax=Musca vetustissima TaxID=27455 RepID=UPI002AB68384|nr:putative methyltransferase C9orf114 [Musca vetustissima]